MDYRTFLGSTSTTFKVNDHVIVCGDTTWQIQNIAATSVGKRVIPFNVNEPKFSQLEPKFSLRYLEMIVMTLVILAIGYYLFNALILPAIVVLILLGVMIFRAFKQLEQEKAQWLSNLNTISKHWKVWNEIKNNPPILYSLMLETNAGSKPLFYSFDDNQIIKARDAINLSMEKKEANDINFEIETVNIESEDAINKLAVSFYNQTLKS